MRRLLLISLLFLVVIPVFPQTQQRLSVTLKWDTGAAIQGTAAFYQQTLGQPDVLLATKPLSLSGSAAFSTILQPSSQYRLVITDTDGTLDFDGAFPTVLLDLQHTVSLHDSLVLHLADKSLLKQTLTLTMQY